MFSQLHGRVDVSTARSTAFMPTSRRFAIVSVLCLHCFNFAIAFETTSNVGAANFRGSSQETHSVSRENSSTTAASPFARKQPRKVHGILFDMDGTLVDSDQIHYETFRDTLLSLTPEFNGGVPINREFYNSEMSGQCNDLITNKLFPGKPLSERRIIWETKEALYRKLSSDIAPLNGLLQLLSRCDQKNLKMIVVTNAPRIDAVHTLGCLGLAGRFESTMVIGAECKRSKPDPAPYVEGLRRLGLEPNVCIAFEDSVTGCRSACAAGLFTVGVMTTLNEETLSEAGAELCIKDFSDERLIDLLQLKVQDSVEYTNE